MEPSSELKLKVAIKAAIAAGELLSDRDLAASVIASEPGLIADLTAGWVLEKIVGLVRLHRNRRRATDPAQIAFPFHDLSVQIPVKDGRVELRGATMGTLKQSERILRAKTRAALDRPRSNSLLGRIQRQIELMQPYVLENRRITVERANELIAAGVAPQPPSPAISNAMRRYWGSKSPEERSDIAYRRRAKRRAGGRNDHQTAARKARSGDRRHPDAA